MRILLTTYRFSIGVLDLAAYYERYGHKVDCALTERLASCRKQYDVVGLSFFGFDSHGVKAPISTLTKRMSDLRKQFPKAELWLGGRALALLPPAELRKLKKETGCAVVCAGEGEKIVGDTIDYKAYPPCTERHVCQQMGGKDQRPDVVAVQSARGCPYSCNFCHRGQKLKFFTPARAAENIRLVDKYKACPMLVDDIFTLRAERMREVRHELDLRGVHYRNRIRFFTHVKHHNEAEIAEFEPDEVQIGIESGDDRMLQLMGKQITRAEAKAAVLRLKEVIPGRLVGLFLFGYPGENEESLRNTVNFVRETKSCYKSVWVSQFTPVPGTVGMEQALEKGKILDRKITNKTISYIDNQLTEEVVLKYTQLMREVLR